MSKKATAAVVHEVGGPYTLEEIELDDLRPDEVYVRLEATGVCHTDANMQVMVPMPAVVGHEGVGVVEEVGPAVDYVKPGDRVILSWPACGVCPTCLLGHRYICDNAFQLLFGGKRLDGSPTIKLNGKWISGAWFQQSSFATNSLVPQNCLVKVDNDLPPEILAALPCGVMTGAGGIISALQVGPADGVLILGAGGVGQAAVMAAKMTGAHPIIAVERNPERLELALELGASHTVNAETEDAVARVLEISGGGVRYAFDSSGASAMWEVAAPALLPGGVFGVCAAANKETLGGSPHIMLSKGNRIQFIMGGNAVPRVFIPKLIEWYKQGRLPVDRIVGTFPFSEINEAFASSHKGETVKPVVLM
ncbi:MAG: NAD(P)-dependent alcohol dehydrogenase [Actinobacteria bacterium]|nr:NAD(P)-dependent alcohol dehydrogenase [Actinomycetota bacterium]